MNIYKKFVAFILLTVSGALFANESVRTLVWGNKAMEITLSVGNERMIRFPQPLVDIQMPQYLLSESISRPELLPDGRLFWLAKQEWDAVRIRAIGADSEVYLLDVSASSKATDTNPIEIVKSIPVDPQVLEEAAVSRVRKGGYDYIDLARYAAQHVYGPSRLIKPLSGVSRVPMEQHVVNIYRGVGLEISTVAQWQSQLPERYITILKVTNTTKQDVDVDPRKLRGDWMFVASHNDSVLPFGYLGDTTHLYAVSRTPFYKAIPNLLHARVNSDNESSE